MSGLLNMGPQDEALLALGLGLLNSKGSFGNALGQSGMQAMQTLNQAKEREQRARQQAQQEEMQRMQVEQMRRQATLDAMAPTMRKPDFMDNRDVGLPGEAQPAPDLGGLAQQYMMAPGGLSRGLQLQEMLKKQKPAPLKVGANDRVLDPETFKELVPALPDKDAGSPLAKLIAERDKFPPGHPARKVYDNAITKATTHQPGVSVSYGSPVAGTDQAGNPVFFQPDKGGGAPAIVPGVRPPKTDKPLTESQAKAAVYKAQMDASEKELATIPIDQTKLASQLDVGMASGTWTNPAASPVAQRARQAQEQWAEVFLRFKTGAASTEAEVKRNVRTFFPQPGDSKEVIEQKARMRKQASHDIGMAAGKEGGSAPSSNVRKYNPETDQLE
jgi:hypothetical protein